MPTDRDHRDTPPLGLRFRVWLRLFENADGWHAKGAYLAATYRKAPAWLRSGVALGLMFAGVALILYPW